MDDEKIIELFLSRSDSAIKCVSEKYGGKMLSLSFNILRNSQDAEECVNDAYLSLWNSIPPTKPIPISPYAYRVTRNLSLTRYRYNTAAKRGTATVSLEQISDCLPDGDVNTSVERQYLTNILNSWLDQLSKHELYVFMRRYWYMDCVEKIAIDLGISVSAVYARIEKLKKRGI